MNTLESFDTTSPNGLNGTCAKFTVDEVLSPFVLHDITKTDEQYILSLWVKSDSQGEVHIRSNIIYTNSEWARYECAYVATDADLSIYFNTPGTYYIYHPKLEIGNKATDWTEAPEDTNKKIDNAQSTADDANKTANNASDRLDDTSAEIKILEDCIKQLVTDGNGNSLMTQVGDRWTFDISGIQNNLNNGAENINKLLNTVNTLSHGLGGLGNIIENLEETSEYIHITAYEDEPCIALGESDTENGLFITNTRIIFIKDSGDPTYIDKDGLYTNKIEVGTELRQKGYAWAVRANGNYGLTWKLIEAVSIEAFFGGVWANVGTELSDLKYISVRVTRSDGTVRRAFGYTLTGTIAEGHNTIAVNYEGLTTSFEVLGMPTGLGLGKSNKITLASWEGSEAPSDITISYADKVQLTNGEISLVSPSTGNPGSLVTWMAVLGKYVQTTDGAICYVDKTATFGIEVQNNITGGLATNSYYLSLGYPVIIT